MFRGIIAAILILTGCGETGGKIEISEIGLSMALPAGWVSEGLEKQDRREYIVKSQFYEPAKRDDNWGNVSLLPLVIATSAGQVIKNQPTLDEYVDNIIEQNQGMEMMLKGLGRILEKIVPGEQKFGEEFQSSVISKHPLTISGFEAIEVVTKANYTIMEVYIGKDDKVITITFRALPEDFPKLEPSFRRAIESIKIK